MAQSTGSIGFRPGQAKRQALSRVLGQSSGPSISSAESIDDLAQFVKPIHIPEIPYFEAGPEVQEAFCDAPEGVLPRSRCLLTNRAPATLQRQSEGRKTIGGVDTVVVSYYGSILPTQRDTLRSLLQAGKSDAQRGGEGIVEVAGYSVAVSRSGVGMAKGKIHCQWHFVCDGTEYSLVDSMEYSEHRLTLQVKGGSEALMKLGRHRWLCEVNRFLRHIGFEVVSNVVGRVDACIDLLDVASVDDFDDLARRGQWVKRATKVARWQDGEQMENIHLGSSSAIISCRIYDKIAEMLSKPDAAKREVVRDVRWGTSTPAVHTRVELQIRGEALRQFKLTSVEEVFANLDQVCDYCLTKWLRFTADSVDRHHTERAKDHPWWALVREMFAECFGRKVFEGRRQARRGDGRLLGKVTLGAFESYLAQRGDLPRTQAELMRGFAALIEAEGGYRVRSQRVFDKRAAFETRSPGETLLVHGRLSNFEPAFAEFSGGGL